MARWDVRGRWEECPYDEWEEWNETTYCPHCNRHFTLEAPLGNLRRVVYLGAAALGAAALGAGSLYLYLRLTVPNVDNALLLFAYFLAVMASTFPASWLCCLLGRSKCRRLKEEWKYA